MTKKLLKHHLRYANEDRRGRRVVVGSVSRIHGASTWRGYPLLGSERAARRSKVEVLDGSRTNKRALFPPGCLLQPGVVTLMLLLTFEPCEIIFWPRVVTLTFRVPGKLGNGEIGVACRIVWLTVCRYSAPCRTYHSIFLPRSRCDRFRRRLSARLKLFRKVSRHLRDPQRSARGGGPLLLAARRPTLLEGWPRGLPRTGGRRQSRRRSGPVSCRSRNPPRHAPGTICRPCRTPPPGHHSVPRPARHNAYYLPLSSYWNRQSRPWRSRHWHPFPYLAPRAYDRGRSPMMARKDIVAQSRHTFMR